MSGPAVGGPAVGVRVDAALGDGVCTLTITNTGDEAVHLFDSPDLPYVLPDDGGGVLVLHGFHEPPPDEDWYGVEIPPTRPLEPGASLSASAPIDPPLLRSAYGSGTAIPGLVAPLRIRTAVGWGATPLDDRALLSLSTRAVCREWQTLVAGPTLTADA